MIYIFAVSEQKTSTAPELGKGRLIMSKSMLVIVVVVTVVCFIVFGKFCASLKTISQIRVSPIMKKVNREVTFVF